MYRKAEKAAPIVILGPMESESEWLIRQLKEPSEHRIGAYHFAEGSIDGYPVAVCRCYIGVVNSAAAAALAIERFAPSCVIIQGTAGAHNPDLHQGDIVLGERTVHTGSFYTPHRDAQTGADVFMWEPHGSEIISVAPAADTPYLYGDSRILDVAAAVPYTRGKVVRGVIGAADIWNRELDMIAHLRKTLGTDCEEMEGFGVMQVCAQLGVPAADIRVISNSEWYPQEEFNEIYGEQCQMFVLDVVRRLIAENTLMW